MLLYFYVELHINRYAFSEFTSIVDCIPTNLYLDS